MSGQARAAGLAHLGERAASLLFEAVASIVIGIDDGGGVMFWNSAAEETFGISSDEVLGQTMETWRRECTELAQTVET